VVKYLSDFPPCFLPKGILTIAKARRGEADAYSGASVAAFNRVPVWLSQSTRLRDLKLGYFLFKEQAINLYQTAEQTASENCYFFTA
jgi:hypothetical protein